VKKLWQVGFCSARASFKVALFKRFTGASDPPTESRLRTLLYSWITQRGSQIRVRGPWLYDRPLFIRENYRFRTSRLFCEINSQMSVLFIPSSLTFLFSKLYLSFILFILVTPLILPRNTFLFSIIFYHFLLNPENINKYIINE